MKVILATSDRELALDFQMLLSNALYGVGKDVWSCELEEHGTIFEVIGHLRSLLIQDRPEILPDYCIIDCTGLTSDEAISLGQLMNTQPLMNRIILFCPDAKVTRWLRPTSGVAFVVYEKSDLGMITDCIKDRHVSLLTPSC